MSIHEKRRKAIAFKKGYTQSDMELAQFCVRFLRKQYINGNNAILLDDVTVHKAAKVFPLVKRATHYMGIYIYRVPVGTSMMEYRIEDRING